MKLSGGNSPSQEGVSKRWRVTPPRVSDPGQGFGVGGEQQQGCLSALADSGKEASSKNQLFSCVSFCLSGMMDLLKYFSNLRKQGRFWAAQKVPLGSRGEADVDSLRTRSACPL